MECPVCGYWIREDEKYCPCCGYDIELEDNIIKAIFLLNQRII